MKTKQTVKTSYTYLTSNNRKCCVNTFNDDLAEKEVLSELSQIFQDFGNLYEFKSILQPGYDIKSHYEKLSHLTVKDISKFKMKSLIKKSIKEKHVNAVNLSLFWKHFVFGFNAIVKKLEKGVRFDVLLIDKSLEDAPILLHIRQLADIHSNVELKMVIVDHGQLKQAVNTDIRHFGKVLMMGVLPCDTGIVNVVQWRKKLLSKVRMLTPDQILNSEQIKPILIENPPITATQSDADISILDNRNKTTTNFNPYITDAGQVNLLIASHLCDRNETTTPDNNDIDYLCDLKRVKVDIPQTTTFIRPPDKNQNKKKKKFNHKSNK